jgi:hypothetical protein
MRIDDALRIARRAGGVAHAAGGILADIGPLEIAVGAVQPLLVGNDVGQRRFGHVGGVGHDDDLLQRFDHRCDLLDDRHEGEVDENGAVGGVVHDPGDLLGKQARIERVVDAAHAHDAEPGLEMVAGVPGQRGDAVAGLKTLAGEQLRDLLRAGADTGIGGAHDRPFHRARDDLAVRVLAGSEIDDLVADERPLLHQSKHSVSSQRCCGRNVEERRGGCPEDFDTARQRAPACRCVSFAARLPGEQPRGESRGRPCEGKGQTHDH